MSEDQKYLNHQTRVFLQDIFRLPTRYAFFSQEFEDHLNAFVFDELKRQKIDLTNRQEIEDYLNNLLWNDVLSSSWVPVETAIRWAGIFRVIDIDDIMETAGEEAE